jgi:hypothetical protein
LEIPGKLFFASHTNHWQGMTAAFLDPGDKESRTKVRAYLITLNQFEHILAQECNIAVPVAVDLQALKSHGRLILGDGDNFFNQLAYLGEHDGHPLITFTNSGEHMTRDTPSKVYLAVLVRGLSQAHSMTKQAALKYLMDRQS